MKFLTATVLILSLAAPIVVHTATPVEARSTIERACLKSDRRSTSRPLCQCIQRVADQMLTRREQKMAAKLFNDPDRAQEIRQSDRASHEDFWRRYKAFGTSASNACQ